MTPELRWIANQIQIKDLKEYESNPRNISKDDFDRLVRDIKQDGYRNRIIVNADNTIIGGHARKKALLKAGFKLDDEIEVLTPSRALTDLELQRINIRDNLPFGEWDFDILANAFDEELLKEWGMPAEWLPEKVTEINENDDVEEIDISKPAITVLGDVWLLGTHRLMCADSTCATDVEKLMHGNKPDLIYTDPPYGIQVKLDSEYKGGIALKGKYRPILNDSTIDVARDCYMLIHSLFDCGIIYWGANYYDFLPSARCWLIWNKRGNTGIRNSFCGTELAYTNIDKHSEIINVLWNGCYREGESNKDKRIHPTQKPIKLAIDCFDYVDAGIKILDLFGGSGSTLIACEKTNRICFMMELDPHYCDAIITRWERITGQKATLEVTNESAQI